MVGWRGRHHVAERQIGRLARLIDDMLSLGNPSASPRTGAREPRSAQLAPVGVP